jgi:hypothetical protein
MLGCWPALTGAQLLTTAPAYPCSSSHPALTLSRTMRLAPSRTLVQMTSG